MTKAEVKNIIRLFIEWNGEHREIRARQLDIDLAAEYIMGKLKGNEL